MRQVYYDGACAVFSSPCHPVTCPVPQPPPIPPTTTTFHYFTSSISLPHSTPHSLLYFPLPLKLFASTFLFLSLVCLSFSLDHRSVLLLSPFSLIFLPLALYSRVLSRDRPPRKASNRQMHQVVFERVCSNNAKCIFCPSVGSTTIILFLCSFGPFRFVHSPPMEHQE